MIWVEKLLGPKSKYDNSLPYTYEARVAVLEWTEAYNSYFSDTICGLIDYLREKNISPDQVALYEIYQEHEAPLKIRYCIDEHDLWLARPRLCESLRDHYKGHIEDGHCSFNDRSKAACGP